MFRRKAGKGSDRGVAQLVGCDIWDVEAASSSLATPTAEKQGKSLKSLRFRGLSLFGIIRFCGAADHRGYNRRAGILRDSFSGLFGSGFVRFGSPCAERPFFVFCGGEFACGVGLVRLHVDGGNRTPDPIYDVGVCSFLFCLSSAILALTSAIIAASMVSHSSGVCA